MASQGEFEKGIAEIKKGWKKNGPPALYYSNHTLWGCYRMHA